MLVTKNVFKSYSNNDFVVENISLYFSAGQLTAIVGESGSGKTSLLHLLAGLTEIDKGDIIFENEKLLPPSELLIAGHPKIKLVAQDFKLYPNLSMRANILYSIRFYDKDYQHYRADLLIENFGLSSVQHHLPKDVSGGEKQRTAIAQSIADEPSVLLLDEPFSQLDVQNKFLLKQEILRLVKEEKISCVFVTHDINDAFSIADKISIIRKGKILQTDTPENIYSNPVNEYTAHLTGLCTFINADDFSFLTDIKSDLKDKSKKALIRPENIFLKEEGKFKGVIKEVNFMGDRYQIGINMDNFPVLRTYTSEKLKLNQEIKFNFKFSEIKYL